MTSLPTQGPLICFSSSYILDRIQLFTYVRTNTMKASFLGDGGTKCLPRRGAELGNRRTSRKPTRVSATVTPHRPTNMVLEKAMYTTLSTTDEMRESKYKDNWFDLLAIHYLTKAIQATTGLLLLGFNPVLPLDCTVGKSDLID